MAPLAGFGTAVILLIIGLGLLFARHVFRLYTGLAVLVIALVAGALAGVSAQQAVIAAALLVGAILIAGVGAVASVALLARRP
ncbi:putative membrane protein [Hamadaea flava]|uniref:Uncharacterized protein n=1 Tax=Hamadaea flava TaxID=1742688 RepID=A0ABV8M135_9ACTN|nr:hypothetical protein [Hamadaea flava]MCP2328604.1 putative membrane protein [Hamadaea flava]